MDYYFQDNLRWSLGWGTPNQAGAFLATLLPLCWIFADCLWPFIRSRAETKRPVRWSLFLVLLTVSAAEVWLWWALAKTYSRGAWVGLACGAVIWGLGMVWARRASPGVRPSQSGLTPGEALRDSDTLGRLTRPWLAVLLRVGVVVTCLFVSNFSARLSPDYTLADRSATNRLDLWKGGLELIAASPVRGWGWGESGAAYMQWTQPLDRTEGYKSMVNSYLTVAVEAGLPVFALVSGALLVPMVLGAWLAQGCSGWRRSLVLGLAACWATWLGCLFFSNLWIIPKLWIVPGLAAFGLIGWSGMKVGRALRARREQPLTPALEPARPAVTPYVGAAMATALLVTLSGWLAGTLLVRSIPLRLKREPTGIVRLESREKPMTDWVEVFPDVSVLGETYGHELRRWLQASARPPALCIQPPVTSVAWQPASHAALVFGEQAAKVPLTGRRVYLVHPTGIPAMDAQVAAGSRVILAGIDPTGARYEWEEWARERRVPVEVNYGLAADVRLRWPEVMTAFGP